MVWTCDISGCDDKCLKNFILDSKMIGSTVSALGCNGVALVVRGPRELCWHLRCYW